MRSHNSNTDDGENIKNIPRPEGGESRQRYLTNQYSNTNQGSFYSFSSTTSNHDITLDEDDTGSHTNSLTSGSIQESPEDQTLISDLPNLNPHHKKKVCF